MPTSQSVIAKFSTKQLVTVRSRRVVSTARMTRVLPTTVTRMMTRKTATASDLGQAMLTRYEFIEGTLTVLAVAAAAAPPALVATVVAAVVWMSRSPPSAVVMFPVARVRAVERNLE